MGRLASDLIALFGFQVALPASFITFTSPVKELAKAVISALAKV